MGSSAGCSPQMARKTRTKATNFPSVGRDDFAGTHGVLRCIHRTLELYSWQLASDSMAYIFRSHTFRLPTTQINRKPNSTQTSHLNFFLTLLKQNVLNSITIDDVLDQLDFLRPKEMLICHRPNWLSVNVCTDGSRQQFSGNSVYELIETSGKTTVGVQTHLIIALEYLNTDFINEYIERV